MIAFGEYSDCSIEEEILVRELDAKVAYTKTVMTPEAREIARKADAIAFTTEKYTPELLVTLENCKILSRFGTGLDNINLQAAADNGIWVSNVPDAFVEEVSTHAIALLLACNRHLIPLVTSSRQGRWENIGRKIFRLKGQTLGLLGFGLIARATAQKAKALGLNVIAYDPYINAEVFNVHGVTQATLEELLSTSDYVSLHLPATESSIKIINTVSLSKMKPSAYLINTSRGALIDEAALLYAVQSGTILGAALDVRSTEPQSPDDPLARDEHIIITPHLAWCSIDAGHDLRLRATMEIVRVLKGMPPQNPANKPTWLKPITR